MDVGYCQIGDSGMETLCDYLSESTILEELTVSSNEFTVESWHYLANALKVNKTLKTLSIDGNKLGDDGCKILSHGISINKSLVSLDIENNDINDDGGNYLLKAVERCETLTDITLKPNPFSSGIEDEIRDLIADRQRKHINQETIEDDSQVIEGKREIRVELGGNDNPDDSQDMKEKEQDESTKMIGKDQVKSRDNEGKEHFEDPDKAGINLVASHEEDEKDQVEGHDEEKKNQVADHDEEGKHQGVDDDEEEKNQVDGQDNEEKDQIEGHDKELNVLIDTYDKEEKDHVQGHVKEEKNQLRLSGEMTEVVDDDTKGGNLGENTENAKNNNYDSIISEATIENGTENEELENLTPKEDLTSSSSLSSSSSFEENSDFEKEKRRHKRKKKKEKEVVKFEKNIPEIRETFENDTDDSPHGYGHKSENEEAWEDNSDDKTNIVVEVENHTGEYKEKIQEIETIKENIKDNLQRSDGELRTENQDNGEEQENVILHENETGPVESEIPTSNRSQEDDTVNDNTNVKKTSEDELGIN